MAVQLESVLGERARAARTRLGLNQAEVAERVGISNEVYGRLERGLMTPRLVTFLRLCDVLGVEPNDLLSPSPGSPHRNDGGSPELRQLVAVLDGADPLVISRVTDVARWLIEGRGPRKRTRKPLDVRPGSRKRR